MASLPRCLFRPLALILVQLLTLAPAPLHAGMLATADCPCGYRVQRMPLFGGRRDFREVCLFPALCRHSGEVVLVNLLTPYADPPHRPAACPTGEIVPYDHPSLAPDHPGEIVFSWRLPGSPHGDHTATLSDGGYFCPRCGKKTLRFRMAGHWD